MENRITIAIAITGVTRDGETVTDWPRLRLLAEELARRLQHAQINGIGVFHDDTVNPIWADTAMTVLVEER